MLNLPNWIRQLSYQPFAVRIVRFLHIRGLMRWVYYRLARPRDKKKRIFFNGIEAEFYVNTYGELRFIEGTFAKGYRNETLVLKRLAQILQPGDVAYDVGTSLGTHTILMAKMVGPNGRIIAFEPETGNYEKLQANISLNSLKNVTSINVALGDSFGLFNLSAGGNKGADKKAKIVPGDILVQNKNLPLPKAVKIDVEGYEYYVIKGLRETLNNNVCKMVCCEIHSELFSHGIKPYTVLDLLKSLGFIQIETYDRGGEKHAICYKSGQFH